MRIDKNTDVLPRPEYREPFICPFHNCITENGWCWECAVETYGYDEANNVYDRRAKH